MFQAKRGVIWLKDNCLLPAIEAIKRARQRFIRYVREHIWLPFCNWCSRSRRRLIANMIEMKHRTVMALIELKRQIIAATMEYIVWPLIACIKSMSKEAADWTYVNVIQPLWLYCEVWLRRSKHYAMIEWIEPAIDWIRERMPEKSPFVGMVTHCY